MKPLTPYEREDAERLTPTEQTEQPKPNKTTLIIKLLKKWKLIK